MEELQSTEILDREILEDARKKALRILKTADDMVRAQTIEWEKKRAESIDDLDKKYNEQRELASGKIMARLPIDKRRAKVEKIESLLQSAIEFWYEKLSRAQIIELLISELAKRTALCEEFADAGQKNVFYSGLELKEAELALKNINGNYTMEEIPEVHSYPSITIEAANVRIIASIQKMVDFLLQEKRAELIEVLLGRAFLEDEA